MRNGKKVRQPKRERGRPQRLDDSALEQVEQLSLAGLSILQMASIMKCSRQALETLLAAHPDLKAKVQSNRENNTALAKLTLHSLLEGGDPETAKWYLQYKAKLELDKARIGLLRAQRRSLEPTTENTPDALPSVYWERVNKYFCSQYQDKPAPTEAGTSDKGDTAEAADPGDNNNGDKTDK